MTPKGDSHVVIWISEHHDSGINVIISSDEGDKRRAWLPHTEISYDKDFNPRDLDSIKKKFPVDSEHYAIVFDKAATDGSLTFVSIAAAENDPWRQKVPQWKVGEPKIMVVFHTTNPEFYTGHIIRGVPAQIAVEDYRLALGTKRKDAFYYPKPGDHICGRIEKIDSARRLITLSASKLFRNMPENRTEDSKQEYALTLTPEDAVKILSDNPDLELLSQNTPLTQDDHVPSIMIPEFKRILIVDNNKSVVGSLSRFLHHLDIQVEGCNSADEARKSLGIIQDNDGKYVLDKSLLGNDTEPITLALIDINLQEGFESGDTQGIELAKQIHSLFQSCRIILFTGEAMTRSTISEKANSAKGLKISDLLLKPVGSNALLMSLQCARANAPRKATDFFEELLPEKEQNAQKKKPYEYQITRESAVQEVLKDLRIELQVDSVFLFSMHPVTYETKNVAGSGIEMGSWGKFYRKLRYSPIADVCLDPRKHYSAWFDNDTQGLFSYAKHRYLLHCYGKKDPECEDCKRTYAGCAKHTYKSCCATRVSGASGDELLYALFVIANKKDTFDEKSALRTDLAAKKIEILLREFKYRKGLKENFPFLMTGRSACSVGHDLSNNLQSVLDIETAISNVKKLKQDPYADVLGELEESLNGMQGPLELARGIAESYRNLSKAQEEKPTICTFEEILEGIGGAKSASSPERGKSKTEIFDYVQDEKPLLKTKIFVCKNAMIRVFQNLFNNSAQQARHKGILDSAICVNLESSPREANGGNKTEGILINIIDTGPGLHWSERTRIFEPSYTTRPEGSGMGLHIVQEEIQEAGGTVDVSESVLGLGTCMTIWLPRACEKDD